MITHVTFAQQIPILGTSERRDDFSEVDGWAIELVGLDVVLARAANTMRQLPEVAPFRVCGVGYCVALEPSAPQPPQPPPEVSLGLAVQAAQAEAFLQSGRRRKR